LSPAHGTFVFFGAGRCRPHLISRPPAIFLPSPASTSRARDRDVACGWQPRTYAFAARAFLCALAISPTTTRAGDDATTNPNLRLGEALTSGSLLLEVRPRFNLITETAKPETTEVTTVRTLVGWRSAPAHDLRLTAQAILTGIVGPHRLNDDPRRFASSPYPLLPDPARQSVNQLHLEYSGFDATKVRVGRQILKLDDERFISDVDFRQTPQVFDGITINSQRIGNTELILGHYWRMRSVLGETSPLRLTVAHGAWNPAPGQSLVTYGYWHNNAATGAQTGFASNAQRIVGLRAEGELGLPGALRANYLGEVAWQRAIGSGDARIAARYYRLGAGVGNDVWTLRADHEEKGSRRGDYGFQTPLTDFYAFNGWALQFTTTPRAGLRDSWLTMRGNFAALEARAEYHRFRSAWGGFDYGDEWDASVTYHLRADTEARLQLARFRAGRDTPQRNSVNKTWLTLTYRY